MIDVEMVDLPVDLRERFWRECNVLVARFPCLAPYQQRTCNSWGSPYICRISHWTALQPIYVASVATTEVDVEDHSMIVEERVKVTRSLEVCHRSSEGGDIWRYRCVTCDGRGNCSSWEEPMPYKSDVHSAECDIQLSYQIRTQRDVHSIA